jgi:DNA-binding beta-propeller fold protein YncE
MLLSSAGIVVLLRSLFRTSTWNSGPAGELPTDGQSALTTASAPVSAPTISTYFVAFCLWWVFGAWLGFTFAGEKMPWLMTHMALPMCILGGWRLGNLVQEIEWPKVWQRQAVGLVGVMPALILVIGVLIWGGPPDGRSLDALSKTIQWLLGIGMIAGLLYLVWRWELVVGWASTTRLLALGGVLLLFFLTIRTSYTLTFINFDMATEYLVYAHASPDIKRALNEIDLISERTVGARNIVVAYDDESSWPMSWYMRQYPNAKYYGQAPNSDNMTAPVIIVGPKNYDKVHPYVVRDYVKRMYRLIWWPDMGYFNLTWADLWKAISDPVQRERNWEIFFYRRWRDVTSEGALGKERDLSKWPHRHEFEMWVRRDLAAEIWDLGVAPVPAPAQQLAVQARSQEIDLTAQAVYNGEYAGLMLSAPRALAIGPEGERVIADTNNHRIVVLDANGGFVRTFGSLCKLSDNVGCVDPDGAGPLAVGDGQLNEPWGVAVDQTGAIFVADTWNGRIQVFGRNGQFLRKWGAFNTTNGELGDAYSLFGPRGLAVDQAGNLLVADTGNKRIIQFSPDGALVAQIGGGGVIGGRFEEPVGVAVSPADGSMVVADTWNRRIQKFTAQLEFTVEMAVPSWDDRSIFMKPYVAVAPNGDIYASDPQFYRVFIYNGAGELKANFGNFGSELNRFGLPNGLAVDQAANTLLVADAANNRIMVFPLAP